MLKKNISYIQRLRDKFRYWLGIKLFDIAKPNSTHLKQNNKFVFLRWDAKWGDAIVSSFVFDAIRKKNPAASITVVTTSEMSGLFREYYGIDDVIVVKKRPDYKELKTLAKQLAQVDVLVHMNANLKMKDLYFLRKVQAKNVAGLDDRINLINLKLGDKTKNMHFAEKFSELLGALSMTVDEINYKVPINESSQLRIAQLLNKKPKQQLVVINPYGNGNARKLTPKIVKGIVDGIFSLAPKLNIAILHSPDTTQEVANICNAYQQANVFYDEQSRSIFDAIALMEKASLVISVDTAIVHIASGLNKPLLAIYNPDHDNFACWHPRSSKASSLFSKEVKPYTVSSVDEDLLATGIKNMMKTNNLIDHAQGELISKH